MPLVEIDALPQPPSIDPSVLVRELNGAIAEAIPCAIDAVWTVWRTVSGPYAVGDRVAFEQVPDSHAVIAHVYIRRTPEQTARVVDAIERVLTRELSLAPGNVFVTVQPVELVEPGS
jgi:hypothetical protein